MAVKKIYLYNHLNSPLAVPGITLELFDANTGALLDKQFSARRPVIGDWGADLTFSSVGSPVDIMITDASYRYPGNCVFSLNGTTTEELNLDLLAVPSTPMGNPPPANSTPLTAINAVKSSTWGKLEKKAVINLINNYTQLATNILPERYQDGLPPELQEVLDSWKKALDKLGIAGLDLDSGPRLLSK
ncbi:hypothetical protein ACFFGT_09800 [Mucilaginibacter angelicae]|uniref:Uncharacterized protein n=1 Tax=Mucilaginibacter angelicae TaxID=869718 RepID=A0ABV6L4Y4_9SPHI